jgi:hypothetical protein
MNLNNLLFDDQISDYIFFLILLDEITLEVLDYIVISFTFRPTAFYKIY